MLVLACGLVAVWLARTAILTALGEFLVKNEPPHKAQAILVLDGDDAGTRILAAAQLATAGYAPIVLVSRHPGLFHCDCETTIAYAERQGDPARLFQQVLTRPDVTSTRSEAVFFRSYLKEHGFADILIVTSNFHTKRAAYLYHSEIPWLRFAVIAAPDPSFTPDGWWKSREGQKTFLTEWLKTFAAHLGD